MIGQTVLHEGNSSWAAEEHQLFQALKPATVAEGAGPLPAGFRDAVAQLGADINDYLTPHVESERDVRRVEREKREASQKAERERLKEEKRALILQRKQERKEAAARLADWSNCWHPSARESTSAAQRACHVRPDSADQTPGPKPARYRAAHHQGGASAVARSRFACRSTAGRCASSPSASTVKC